MSPALRHECTRVPVTALSSCGALLVAAEGPFLRFYYAKDFRFIATERVFKAQAVHGISLYSEEHSDDQVVKLVIWGGRLARALQINIVSTSKGDISLKVQLSNVAKAPDWILDLTPRPSALDDEDVYDKGTCVAVTAHNALLQLDIERVADLGTPFLVSFSELTASSRSILYSAHVYCESRRSILVAAGTAFGEIIYWSWSTTTDNLGVSRVHRVFLGHEGSIFGVRISQEFPTGCCQNLKRVIASCSDDRTIRVWDVSDVNTTATSQEPLDSSTDADRTRHTGFSNESFDQTSHSSSDSLAIGWGHTSRVWTVHFLESSPCDGAIAILSTGEDATSRTWRLIQDQSPSAALPYKLTELDCAAHHSGKSIWSFATHGGGEGFQQVVCGGADSKITGHRLIKTTQIRGSSTFDLSHGYTVYDVLSLANPETKTGPTPSDNHRSSKKAEFFRSYCALSQEEFLLTTNSGKVVLVHVPPQNDLNSSKIESAATLDQLEDLAGYSVCTSLPTLEIAFIAGSRGNVYMYRKNTSGMQKLTTVNGKVGDMFLTSVMNPSGENRAVLLSTLVGQKQAQLDFLESTESCEDHTVYQSCKVPISETLTGSMCTSMAYLSTNQSGFLFIGFRRGSIAIYRAPSDISPDGDTTLFRVIDRVHGEETVTALQWIPSSNTEAAGNLLSVGRDGRLAVHKVDLLANTVELVHDLTLPLGPNIEGLYIRGGHLLVHGFSNKKWVLYDVDTEEEVMGVETGGAHRSWAFQPTMDGSGGTLVWTRAASMHIYCRPNQAHNVIRSGGHGREIKAVAVSPDSSHQLIATGAEDTDIKLFKYVNGEVQCKRTLRKHTTGIQHLQWSEDGNYLFSSGGCEEFFVWRIRPLPDFLEIGVVCEHIYASESEHSDLRIMSFDILQRSTGYIVAMVFSDSSLKTYRYDPTAPITWQPLAKGIYFTSCLTQCNFITDARILTAGTDGHAALWDLGLEMQRPFGAATTPPAELSWYQPIRIHQNSSKCMSTLRLKDNTMLVASGGDDGSLAFIRLWIASPQLDPESPAPYAGLPLVISRTHASAVTACAMFILTHRILLVTSGNDEWVRLWEIRVEGNDGASQKKEIAEEEKASVTIDRLGKVKTSVADVSSMTSLDSENDLVARVLVCGVGMEIIRIDLDNKSP